MQRVLRGAPAAISITFYDGETPVDSDDPVTIQVLRNDGTEVVDAGTPTTAGDVDSGTYTYVLTGDETSDVDILTAHWTAVIGGGDTTLSTQVEVVGGFYVSLAELRAQKNLIDTNKFTTAELVAAREWFEDKFEDYTQVAWVPRYKQVRVNGTARSDLILPDQAIRTIRSVRVYSDADTYTDFTADELADLDFASGVLTRRALGPFIAGVGNVVVEYEHGYDAPPSDVKEAALVAARDKLIGDQTGNRVYAVQTEDGIVRSSTPGRDTPFGIPFVDEVATRRSHRVPAVG